MMSPHMTHRTLRRLLVAAILIAAGLCAIPATAAPAAAPAASPAPPGLTHVHVSKHHLPGTGGHVRVSGAVQGARRCRLRVRPALPHRGFDKPCRGSRVHWRIRIPANDVRHPRTYRLMLLAIGPHHAVTSRHRSIVVGRPLAPHFKAFSVSASHLPSTGGVVRFAGTPKAAHTCTLTVTPSILGLPQTHRCGTANIAWSVRLPPNPVDAVKTFHFTIQTRGAANQLVRRTTTITEAAQSPTCPGQTDTAPPRTAAFFNDPTSALTADHQIVVNAMINLICSASPPVNGVPTAIDFAMYVDESEAVSKALIWAQQYRSAVVRVALDGENAEVLTSTGETTSNPAYQDLIAALPPGSVVLCGANAGKSPLPPNGDLQRPSPPTQQQLEPTDGTIFAGSSCAGDNILHDKLLAVSSVDNLGDAAVLTSSQNLSNHAVASAFNNGLQLVGSKAVYNSVNSYFDQLMTNTREPQLGENSGGGPFTTDAGAVTFTTYPRNSTGSFPLDMNYDAADDKTTDAIAALLDQVSCAAPGSHAGDHSEPDPQTTVRIAMYSYGPRDLVTNRLAALSDAGCEVKLIYSTMSSSTRTALLRTGIALHKLNDSSYPLADGTTGRIFLHDKYLLISGALVKSGHLIRNQDIVQSGSENFTELGLHHNDDQTLSIRQTATGDPNVTAIYNAYDENWTRLMAAVKVAKG